ncbi:hypothetical protein DSM03_101339 [Leeuwenhoekiella aestuarii]|uniref:Uncharacterized protein n=1 Tax=Leeuwenhoekiella aestuarii TaxID=2249426 RepID=A0A4Q0NT94_9FLAO|nr:hypothetical protein [Leeuwenhoekiella aestuarii]RXG14222.1 hypothetical protein DSM04_104330 [Leeuwenhoekiella aestuarii]RXG18971.1 hypothetical protein DSM03_101339 [Leeuwenhoekiella aestuarii]
MENKNFTITPTGLLYIGEDSANFNQLIYASQLYGTFFAVYAKISSSRTESDKTGRQIDEITFRVVNYKGIIDIGLEKAEYNISTKEIDLFVKALGNTSKEIKCKNLNKLRKEKEDILVFRRQIEYLPNRNNSGVFEIEKYYRDGTFTQERPDYESHPIAPGARCMLSELKVLI